MNIIKPYLYIQSVILLGGTAFAWIQWFQEYFGSCSSCSTGEEFFSKCLIGALFFTFALILNLIVVYVVATTKEKK